MIAEINYLPKWIPEQMSPGTVFMLDSASGDEEDPYLAVLACPCCGTVGLITRKQMAGIVSVICGSDQCSAQFHLHGDDIVPRLTS